MADISKLAIPEDLQSPYDIKDAKSRQVITTMIDSGPKNLIRVGFPSTTANSGNLTITNNLDGSITVNGTASSSTDNSTVVLNIYNGCANAFPYISIPVGKYYIQPPGDGLSYDVRAVSKNGNSTYNLSVGEDNTFTYTEANSQSYPFFAINLQTSSNATFSNYTFKPFMCLYDEYDISSQYTSFSPTNTMLQLDKMSMGYGIPVPASADFNDYKNPGVYQISETITNQPQPGQGRLEVKIIRGGSTSGVRSIMQTFFPFGYPERIYIRGLTGTSWSSWYRFDDSSRNVTNVTYSTSSIPTLSKTIDGETTTVFTVDTTATSSSKRPVTSGGAYNGLYDVAYNDSLSGTRNIARVNLSEIVAANQAGTWSGNVYTYMKAKITVKTDGSGEIIVESTGAIENDVQFIITPNVTCSSSHSMQLFGCPTGGGVDFDLRWGTGSTNVDSGSGCTITESNTKDILINLASGYNPGSTPITFKPMLCSSLAYSIDPTFIPWSPNASDVYKMLMSVTFTP